ncbi:MAG: DsbA family protein, partial [Pseudomonadota bacterium]
GILETAHGALFKSIHDDGEQYADDQSVMDFFIKQGVKPEDFIQAFRSTEVDENVSQARVLTVKYGIRGVPAIIVNGKYRTAQYFTGTQEKLLEVLDMLVEKERSGH